MEPILVTCAVIEKEFKSERCFLVCQRSESMRLPLKWEFPGGKIEAAESAELCLKREIKEELALDIEVGKALTAVKHIYPAGQVILMPYFAHITGGNIKLLEHKTYNWQPKHLLSNLDWAEADIPIVRQLLIL